MAWKASSAAFGSFNTAWHVFSTIAPCRVTSAANAASSRWLTNRSSKRASDKPVHVPVSNSCWISPSVPDRNAVAILRAPSFPVPFH